MGGLAPGKLKSRRGWPSSPRRLIHGCYFFDPGFKNSLREKLYQLCGNGDTLIAIDSRRPGLFWSAKVALSFAATGTTLAYEAGQAAHHSAALLPTIRALSGRDNSGFGRCRSSCSQLV